MIKVKRLFAIALAAVLVSISAGGCFLIEKPAAPAAVSYKLVFDSKNDLGIKVAETALKSVVEIRVAFGTGESAKWSGTSSGVIIGAANGRTYIITNNRVISGETLTGTPSKIEVLHTLSGVKTDVGSGNILKLTNAPDTKNVSDLALFWIPYSDGHTPCAYSEDVSFGQPVMAAGNLLEYGMSVCDGVIGSPSAYIELKRAGAIWFKGSVILHSAAVNGGSAGGGLFDMKANLIGINTVKAETPAPNDDPEQSGSVFADSLGFALDMKHVVKFVEDYTETQKGVPDGNYFTMLKTV